MLFCCTNTTSFVRILMNFMIQNVYLFELEIFFMLYFLYYLKVSCYKGTFLTQLIFSNPVAALPTYTQNVFIKRGFHSLYNPKEQPEQRTHSPTR